MNKGCWEQGRREFQESSRRGWTSEALRQREEAEGDLREQNAATGRFCGWGAGALLLKERLSQGKESFHKEKSRCWREENWKMIPVYV